MDVHIAGEDGAAVGRVEAARVARGRAYLHVLGEDGRAVRGKDAVGPFARRLKRRVFDCCGRALAHREQNRVQPIEVAIISVGIVAGFLELDTREGERSAVLGERCVGVGLRCREGLVLRAHGLAVRAYRARVGAGVVEAHRVRAASGAARAVAGRGAVAGCRPAVGRGAAGLAAHTVRGTARRLGRLARSRGLPLRFGRSLGERRDGRLRKDERSRDGRHACSAHQVACVDSLHGALLSLGHRGRCPCWGGVWTFRNLDA